MGNFAVLLREAGEKMSNLKTIGEIQKANQKYEQKITREIISDIFKHHKVPEFLRQSFWRAYNAAHQKQEPKASIARR